MSNELTLDIPGHLELHVSTRSGRVYIQAEERDDLHIESDAPIREEKIHFDATGRLALKSSRGGSGWLKLRVPNGADMAIGTVSGNVELRGAIGRARVTTISGKINVEQAEALDLRTISGTVEVDRCAGKCKLNSKSGNVSCGQAGQVIASTISGKIDIGQVSGKVAAQSASGRIDVGMSAAGDVAVRTMSGAVRVEVPKGVRPHPRLQSLSGRPTFGCERGDDCEIKAKSLSGKIEVLPA
jgi:DUF4097 and DUF4098 domain-containing protein YvlB